MKKLLFVIAIGLLSLRARTQPGALNKNFGNNGVIETVLGGNGNTLSGYTRNSFVQPDGKILVVVEFTFAVVINRRLANGSIDSSYGKNGFSVPVNMNQPSAAIQSDGKLVVVGETSQVNSEFITARFTTSGTLDASFGNSGITITNAGSENDALTAVAIQSDNKIIAGGESYRNGISQFALIRYNTNGTADPSYGNNGLVITNFGNSCNINALVLQPGNKVVAVGNYNDGTNGDFAIARYLINGSLDTSFNGSGEVTSNFGNSDNAISVALQTNGKILVGGYYTNQQYNSHFEIARYNANGSIDSSFNGTGVAGTNFGSTEEIFASLAVQSNGKIIAGGYIYTTNGFDDLALARFNVSGGIDSSFGLYGQVLDSIGNGNYNFLNCLTLESNGQILSGGYTQTSNSILFTLSRFNTNGSLDNSFGTSGNVQGFYPGNAIYYDGMMVQSDEKIVVNGYTSNGVTYPYFLTRLNQNGSTDLTYGNKGMAVTNGYYAVMQSDGKVVESYYNTTSTGYELMLSRYNTNGSPDLTYGTNGIVLSDFFGGSETYGPTAIQADNKVVVAGYIENSVGTDLLLARFNTDGTPDLSFGNGGAITVDFEPSDYPQTIAIGSNGKILVGEVGYTASYQGVVVLSRFNPNGSLDSSFAKTGYIILSPGLYAFSGTVASQNDGKILLSYEVSSNYSTYYSYVTRYKSNGITDSLFGVNGTIPVAGSDLQLEGDQKILISGRATDAQNNLDFSLARYKTNGIADSTFGTNGTTITKFAAGENYVYGAAISNNELIAEGAANDPLNIGILAEYQLGSQSTLTGPSSVTASADSMLCSTKIKNLDPVVLQADTADVKYEFTGSTTGSGTGSVSGLVFNGGVTNVTYSLLSDSTKSYSFTVTVKDKEAPVISKINKKILVNPSDDQSVDVLLDYTATDNCGPVTNSVVVSGSSFADAPAPFENNSKDLQIIDDHHLKLNPVETDNAFEPKRVFRIQVISTDLSGNRSIESDTLTIPESFIRSAGDFIIRTAPNPTSNSFNITYKSDSRNELVSLRLINAQGIILQTINNVLPGQTVNIGSSLLPGFYLLEANKANSTKTFKLLKL
jgi:uncharacterized delta-60 repeat protein